MQRVRRASVRVDGKTVGEISSGVLVLLGIGRNDGEDAISYMADKIANLRIFEDESGKMNRSLLESKGAALVVSQFTLYGDARKGRRPSFIDSAPPHIAEPLYQRFVLELRRLGVLTETGAFRADMQVKLVNDGPVTILLDSERLF